MPAPDSSLVKAWCRIDDQFDEILPMMIESATLLASHATGHDYAAEEMPTPVQQWVAANVAHWIENPAAASDRSPILPGLLDPFRTYQWTPAA